MILNIIRRYKFLKESIKLKPDIVFVLDKKGDAYFRVGNHSNGISSYKEAVKIHQ